MNKNYYIFKFVVQYTAKSVNSNCAEYSVENIGNLYKNLQGIDEEIHKIRYYSLKIKINPQIILSKNLQSHTLRTYLKQKRHPYVMK